MSFKLPLEYHPHNELNDIVKNDIELNNDDSILNSIFSNDASFNLLMSKYNSLYSVYKPFLKDTQKLISKFKYEDNDNNEISKKMMKAYIDFAGETSFDEKYQYITFSYFRSFNKNPLFLQYLGLYNLSSPVLSLVTPILGMIVPYFILRVKGIKITISSYFRLLKTTAFNSRIFSSLFNFSAGNLNQKLSVIISVFFYFMQIYQNIMFCYRFNRNLNNVHEFIHLYKNYLNYSINNIEKLLEHTEKFDTYNDFNTDLKRNHSVLNKMLKSINLVFTKNNFATKLSQMGLLLKINYTLFYDTENKNSFEYSLFVNQYMNDIGKINKLAKTKKLNKRKFNNTGKKYMKSFYYVKLINEEKCIKNDITFDKNSIITGPNASGKTTCIKSILLNMIMSQQFGYGCFKKCSAPIYQHYHSYLNIPDTSNRDSLFQAEARRCKDIFEYIYKNKDDKHFCIFDEIYSGTNPNDATLCAELYLKALNKFKKNVDFIITTHYIDLCESFENNKNSILVNKRMNVICENDNIRYTYNLENGISKINGGKQVLIDLNYPEFILKP